LRASAASPAAALTASPNAPTELYRHNLSLKAKVKSGSSYVSFKR
jgi:hypothetical protein